MTSDVAMDSGVEPTGESAAPVEDGGAPASEVSDGGFSIPEEYAGRGWAEKVSSYDDLFKSYDNAQSMIGKKSVPSEDAGQEEWDNFYNQIGRPESADGYEYTNPENLPEDFDLGGFDGMASKLFHEIGLTKSQADKMRSAYLGLELESLSKQQETLDAEFDEVTKDLFGDKFDEVSPKLQSLIGKNVPEKYIDSVKSMAENQPKEFAIVMALADNMNKQVSDLKQKYGAEDNLSSGSQASGSSREEVLKQMMEVRGVATKSDPFSSDRRDAESKLVELRKQLNNLV